MNEKSIMSKRTVIIIIITGNKRFKLKQSNLHSMITLIGLTHYIDIQKCTSYIHTKRVVMRTFTFTPNFIDAFF